MSAFDDANELIRHAESDFAKIREAYEASLHAKAVSGTLRVQIKNFVENLRSALDFAAHGLFDRFGSSPKANPKIYFPYATAGQDRAAFEKGGRIETCIPGLTASRPDIVQSLLEIKGFAQNDVVAYNRIRGRARAALSVDVFKGGVPSNNAFVLNRFDHFEAATAHVFVGEGVTDTLILGQKGTSEDHRMNTVVVPF